VTAAFEGVFALRTKAEFDAALRDIQTVAMQFSQNWYRMARCRRTMQICTEKGLRVTPEMVESTEVARTEQLYSCSKAAAELLSQAGIKLQSFSII
jgi:hypothetical protein